MNFIDRYNKDLENDEEEETVTTTYTDGDDIAMQFQPDFGQAREATRILKEDMCELASYFYDRLHTKYTRKQIAEMVTTLFESFQV